MRLGIDLGGTKTEIIALAPDGAELMRERTPTPREDYDGTIRTICDLVAAAEQRFPGRAFTVGVGQPGSHNPATGLVQNANSTWLNGKPFEKDLSAALGRDVICANDANCFALSEAADGAAAGAATVFGVILGTGVGGGLVVNGAPITGAHAVAGEWGHLPLPHLREDDRALDCFCGHKGCIETFLSGPAMQAEFKALTGRDMSATDIAGDNSPEAKAHMARWVDRLARGLSLIVNIFDPEAMVFGGGLSALETIYSDLPEKLAHYAAVPVLNTRILKNMHGASSGVRGAAWLWPHDPETLS